MTKSYDQSELVTILKKYIFDHNGVVPSRNVFIHQTGIGRHFIEKHFKTWEGLLAAIGQKKELAPGKEEQYLKRYKSICLKKELIQGHFRHILDLNLLFEKAGRPASLKMIAMPDTHAKFMDKPAVKAFIKFCAFYNPDIFGILGDLSDCEGLSHWPDSSMEPRRIVPEMKITRQLLQEIQDATPKATTRFFCMGNHEDWINQALTRMPEFFDGLEDLDIEITPEKLMGLSKHEYEIFPLNHLVQIGKAHFTHGLFTGTHHAKKHLDTLKANIYYGHLHDTQEFNQTSMEGHLEASSLACLCRLDAKFLKGRPNNWVHGFGIFEFFPDGNYTFLKPKIFNGRFSYFGQVFDGNIL